MFIKVTRLGSNVKIILQTDPIRAICTGYENRGSRIMWAEKDHKEMEIEESVDEVWRRMDRGRA